MDRGDFAHGEESTRARDLFASWNRHWSAARPLGYELRGAYSDQWVRFHSLPGSKRYAESEPEAREVLHRARTMISELFGSHEIEALVVIAQDWGAGDLSGGWSRAHLPTAWPWASTVSWRLPVDAEDPEAPPAYFWVASGLNSDALDELLAHVADDEAHCVITDPSTSAVFCPYDGGMDVLAPTARDRDLLKARHADWLSSRSDGL